MLVYLVAGHLPGFPQSERATFWLACGCTAVTLFALGAVKTDHRPQLAEVGAGNAPGRRLMAAAVTGSACCWVLRPDSARATGCVCRRLERERETGRAPAAVPLAPPVDRAESRITNGFIPPGGSEGSPNEGPLKNLVFTPAWERPMSFRNRGGIYRPWEDYLPPAFRLAEGTVPWLAPAGPDHCREVYARSGRDELLRGGPGEGGGGRGPGICEPSELWLGYGGSVEEFLAGGRPHVAHMRDLFGQSGYIASAGPAGPRFRLRVRMTRHLIPEGRSSAKIWGCDIQGDAMLWCKTHLSPPLNFLTSTTIPHLPFEDRFFHLIYAGSVFTHIEDLAEAWLQELREGDSGRPDVPDDPRPELDPRWRPCSPTRRPRSCFHAYWLYRERRHDHRLLVIGRDRRSHVFYDLDYFTKTVARTLEVVSVVPQGYGFQTAVILTRRDG